MQLVLIGYMGSGKSAIGKLLSDVTGISFQDLDSYIESSEGTAISDIFKTKGEIYFRKTEAGALTEILSNSENIILATGGGTPCYGSVMKDLLDNENVITIYLNCIVETLTQRLWKERDQRPLISHIENMDVLNEFIRKHLFERAFYYNQAHLKISCDVLSEKEIVEKIILQLF